VDALSSRGVLPVFSRDVPSVRSQQLRSVAPCMSQRLSVRPQATAQSASSSGSSSTSSSGAAAPASTSVFANAALLRKVVGTGNASEAADLIATSHAGARLTDQDCVQLITSALEKGNIALALSVHESMCRAKRAGNITGSSSLASIEESIDWPAATVQATSALVLGLCRQLAIDDALRTISDIRVQGLPRNEAVGFGKVIASPLAPNQTLTVVQPQEGCKFVADAFSRYEYEVFSGRVVTIKSEALQISAGILFALLRGIGILKKPPPAAVHEFVVQAPDGTSRTFRVATPTADVPAQKDERITMVCAPGPGSAKSSKRKRQQGLLDSSPPDTKPGEALTATNHKTGVVTQLLRPPLSGTQTALPGWVLPAIVVLAGGDAASTLIDPALPALIAGSVVTVVGSGVAGNQLLLPRLKQLPEKALGVEYVRQRLLGQYAQLASKVASVTGESNEDVRVLARLWQLQNKMQSVAAGATASYGARMERVAAARTNIEERLVKKLELLDGYSRVMNMIEIEVEMDIEVPAAELAGIEQQMERLTELESLQDDWRVQAEARDEVERLLRTV